MPNWCQNRLRIEADDALLAEIKEFVSRRVDPTEGKRWEDLEEVYQAAYWGKDRKKFEEAAKPENRVFVPLVFAEIVPPPEGEYDWYSWNCENFGTKWDLDAATTVQQEDGALVYAFDTAWAPPMPVVQALARQFPDAVVTLTYLEVGGDFCGRVVCQGDEILEVVDDSPDFGEGGEDAGPAENHGGLPLGPSETDNEKLIGPDYILGQGFGIYC